MTPDSRQPSRAPAMEPAHPPGGVALHDAGFDTGEAPPR